MFLTLRQAAKATGVAPTTISRAIEGRRLNGRKNENGSYEIEPSELFRVFPPVAEKLKKDALRKHETTLLKKESGQPENSGLIEKIKGLEALLLAKDETRNTLEKVISDLQEDRDKWREQATQLLLTDQRPKPEPQEEKKADQPQSSLLYKLFGRR
ncbi:hypothetical protein [Methylovulum psychrotolerans]|uniref:Uncharacterized protein n=1 Tax=Methylovulum psychrotolerans TaxID=1704499 RepID=A0A1Z4C3K2_9GAMM|nr:hypothetical protein [Methylovulum psychrotolerans]ASF48121.1 hypothetical protein CEK71_19765 [Methylovulum psychrotolerans]